jgi:hypothetical protein
VVSFTGPGVGLDDVEKRKFLALPGLELLPLDHPARSQSLYRLRYPGSSILRYYPINFLLKFKSSRKINYRRQQVTGPNIVPRASEI